MGSYLLYDLVVDLNTQLLLHKLVSLIISNNMDIGKIMGAVFFDLKQAFGVVNYKVLQRS